MARKSLPQVTKTMIEEFQCPGCVAGSNIECGAFQLYNDEGCFRCDGHVPGTMILPGVGTIILGLPKGFNRLGPRWENMSGPRHPRVRLWPKGSKPEWDNFNIPVWAMEKDGYLFVRTYMPRVNYPMVDVIEGGTLDLCPNAVNVAEFYEGMD